MPRAAPRAPPLRSEGPAAAGGGGAQWGPPVTEFHGAAAAGAALGDAWGVLPLGMDDGSGARTAAPNGDRERAMSASPARARRHPAAAPQRV